MLSVSFIVLAVATVTLAMYPGNMNPGNMYPGNMNPGNMNPGNMYPGRCIPNGQMCGSSFGKCCLGNECKGFGMGKRCQSFPIGK